MSEPGTGYRFVCLNVQRKGVLQSGLAQHSTGVKIAEQFTRGVFGVMREVG